MDKPEVTILQALENEEVFVSVRKNRHYKTPDSSKASFKLVLAITAERGEGDKIISKIKANNISEVLLEAHQDTGIYHLLVYCNNAETVNQVIRVAFNGHTLRSNTRYEIVTSEELQKRAQDFEAVLK
jgi:hypothetical protein